MTKLDKLYTLKSAIGIYVTMCKDLVNKETSIDEEFSFKNVFQNKGIVSVKSVKANSMDYLSNLNKYLLKISMIDQTELNSVIRNNTLYLSLTKKDGQD